MRLKGKVAIVVGAGQKRGLTMGNGRATAILFAREGAKVLAVDRHLDSAKETVAMIEKEGGQAFAVAADVTVEDSLRAAVASCLKRWERIDILHNNVGMSLEGGDAEVTEITPDVLRAVEDRIVVVA